MMRLSSWGAALGVPGCYRFHMIKSELFNWYVRAGLLENWICKLYIIYKGIAVLHPGGEVLGISNVSRISSVSVSIG